MLFGLILFQPTTQNNNAAIPPPIFFLDENMDFNAEISIFVMTQYVW